MLFQPLGGGSDVSNGSRPIQTLHQVLSLRRIQTKLTTVQTDKAMQKIMLMHTFNLIFPASIPYHSE